MLVLSRKLNQRILIGDDVVLTVVRIKGSSVQLGIEAPSGIEVVREELLTGETMPRARSADRAVPTGELARRFSLCSSECADRRAESTRYTAPRGHTPEL